MEIKLKCNSQRATTPTARKQKRKSKILTQKPKQEEDKKSLPKKSTNGKTKIQPHPHVTGLNVVIKRQRLVIVF